MLRRSLLLAAALCCCVTFARDRERTYDLIHVDWSVSFDEEKAAIFGDVTNTLAPLKPTNEIDLDCGKLTVRRVTVNGEPTEFKLDKETLRVMLNQQAKAGERLEVRVVYHGVPEAGVYFIPASRAYPAHTSMIYTQGEAEDNRYWMPSYDFPNDKASSSAHITVKPGQYALSNGKLERIDKTDTAWTYNWTMPQPHSTYLNAFIAGESDTGHEDWDGLDVFWAVPKGMGSMGHASFDGTADMVKLYSQITGFKYPYAKFSQGAVSDFMFGGMENITMVTQTIFTLHEANEEPVSDSEGLVLHELAHQWFGDTITCRDWAHIWVNEGWATFMPHFYVRYKHGQDAFDLERYGTMQGALGAALSSKRPMISDEYAIPMDMFDGNAYGGGAARMFMLMDMIGEEAFWRATKKYLEENKYKNVTTETLFDVFSQVSGKDLGQFRKQWFYTAGAPQITSSMDGSVMTLSQKEPYYSLEVPIGVFKDGKWTIKPIHLSGASASEDIGPIAGAAVMVDPEGRLMAQYSGEPDLSKEQVATILVAPGNAATRARLAPKMAGWTSAEKQAVYNGVESVSVRNMLLQQFGKGDEAFLISESRVADPRLSATATQRLTACEMTDAVLARLRDVYRNSPNPRLREAACRALVNATNDASLVEQAWGTDSTDQGFRSIALDWWVQHDKEKARQVCLEQLRSPLNELVRISAIRYLGGLKDADGSRDVFNALISVLGEGSFSARTSAMNALMQYGDKAALPAIAPLRDNSLFMMRQTAQAAYSALGGQ